MMKRLVFLISVILASFCAPGMVAAETVKLKYKGIDGQWFPDSMVEGIQVDLLELDGCRLKIPKLELEINLRLEQIEDLETGIDAVDKALNIAEGNIGVAETTMDEMVERFIAAEERADRAEDKESSIWRHPLLWTGVGAVFVVAAQLVFYGLVK